MNVVLDTSAAVELILGRTDAAFIKEILTGCSKVISSDLYIAETTNVFWKYVKAGQLIKEDAVTAIELSHQLVDEYYDMKSFSIECLSEALRLNHSTYDMLYLTLAKRTGAGLLTLDKRLNNLAQGEGISTPLLR